MDDAASEESLLCHCVLHDFIICMGVDADMIDAVFGKTYGRCKYTAGAFSGNAVNRSVGCV